MKLLLTLLALLIHTVSAAEPLRVMTFNLRYASDQSPNAWGERLPVMRALLEKSKPHIFGTQEGLYRQLKDLSTALPNYHWIGLGRDGGSRGEFMAIFYDHARFEPLEYDHFWLSDTPNVIASATWGHTNRRMVTWVKFKDRANDKAFYFFNTHFDHANQSAREKAAALLRERVAELKTDLPIIVMGDFNAAAGKNKTFDILTEGNFLRDTWESAERRPPIVNTFHNFQGPTEGEARIDWILTRGPLKARWIQIDTFSQNGQFPSDHFPVTTELTFE